MMLIFGLVALVSCHLAGSAQAEGAPFISPLSKCRWDKGYTLSCSFAGITDLPSHDTGLNPKSKVLLSKPIRLLRMAKHIDLSHNSIQTFHGRTFCNFSSLETLNLSTNHIHAFSLDGSHWSDGHDGRTVTEYLPALKTLLIDRNRLNSVPKGLGNLRSLRALSVSYNRIVRIGQNDFANCTKLKTIDLEENRICEIHPDAFRDTRKLQVLLLRGNALTTITPLVFIFSHILHVNIDLSDNPWVCDCRMHDLKHFLSFLSINLRREWSIICSSPPSTAGNHLLSIEDFFSTCERSIESTDQTRMNVKAGKQTVLPCDVANPFGDERVFWWTPRGPISEKHEDSSCYMDKRKNLILTVSSRAEEGLYLCVSDVTQQRITYQVHVDIEDLPVPKRSSRNVDVMTTQGWSQQDFTLAVCLSVIISFICAFCLGVFVRPFLEVLWKKCCKREKPKQENQETAYTNDGFTEGPCRDYYDSANASMSSRSVTIRTYGTDSSGSYVTVHEGRQSGIITRTTAAITPRQDGKAAMVWDMDLESESTDHRYDPDTDGGQHERRGTYTMKDKGTPINDGLQKTIKGESWENDNIIYKHDIPLRRSKCQTGVNMENHSDTNDVRFEILKSPKNKQLFIGSNSHDGSHLRCEDGDEAHHTTFDNSPNNDRIGTKNVDSAELKAFDTTDMHKHIEKNISRRSESSTSDEGSDFSFALSNSLSDTSEVIEVTDEDENACEGAEMSVKPSRSSGEYNSYSPNELNTPPGSRKDSRTISPVQNENTQQSTTASDTESTSESEEGYGNNSFKRDLQGRESNNLEGGLEMKSITIRFPVYSTGRPRFTSIDNKTAFNHQSCLVPRKLSETPSTDESTSGTSLSNSDRHPYKKMQNSDVTTADPEPYKAEAVLRWLQTTTNGLPESQANYVYYTTFEDDSSDLNSQEKEENDLLDLTSEERKEVNALEKIERNPIHTMTNSSEMTEPTTINLTMYDANSPTVSSINSKIAFNEDDQSLMPQKPSETSSDQSACDASQSSSDGEEHGGAFPGDAERHQYRIIQNNDVESIDADPYKTEDMARRLQTTTNDHVTSHASDPSDMTSEAEDFSDVDLQDKNFPDLNSRERDNENVMDYKSQERKSEYVQDLNSQESEREYSLHLRSKERKPNDFLDPISQETKPAQTMSEQTMNPPVYNANSPTVSSIKNKTTFNYQHRVMPQEQSETSTDRSTSSSSQSPSDDEGHGGAFPDTEEQRQYKKTQNELAAADKPYEAGAVASWSQATTNDYAVFHAADPSDTTSEEEDFLERNNPLDVSSLERKENLLDLSSQKGMEEKEMDHNLLERKEEDSLDLAPRDNEEGYLDCGSQKRKEEDFLDVTAQEVEPTQTTMNCSDKKDTVHVFLGGSDKSHTKKGLREHDFTEPVCMESNTNVPFVGSDSCGVAAITYSQISKRKRASSIHSDNSEGYVTKRKKNE